MDVSLNNTLLQGRSNNVDKNMKASEGESVAEQLEAQAMDDALWRMAANNAMAKIKGFNALAKAANELS